MSKFGSHWDFHLQKFKIQIIVWPTTCKNASRLEEMVLAGIQSPESDCQMIILVTCAGLNFWLHWKEGLFFLHAGYVNFGAPGVVFDAAGGPVIAAASGDAAIQVWVQRRGSGFHFVFIIQVVWFGFSLYTNVKLATYHLIELR